MGRLAGNLVLIGALVGLQVPAATAASAANGERLQARVRQALESGDSTSLANLFPADRKVRVSLDRIADLQGFVGAGPLVEAFRRYLSGRTDLRFEADAHVSGGADDPTVRLRGVLCSRDKSGRREKVGLVFVFEKIGGERRAVEVRETG